MKQKNLFTATLVLSLILFSVTGCRQQTVETNASAAEDVSITDIEEDDTPVYLNCKSDDRSNHVLLKSKENGPCQTLTGDVLVTVVFVTDPESTWSEQDIADVKTACENGSNNLMQAAQTYGSELNIRLNYANSTIDSTLSRENLVTDDVLKAANLPEAIIVTEYLENTYSVKEAPLIFVLNRMGRSGAYNDNPPEFVLWYLDSTGDLSQDTNTYQHELLHLFGAVDLYYPENITELASEYMPDSIMNGGETIDEFTAYLVGWTNEFTEAAHYFYQETLLTTAEEIGTALAEETSTGYKTIPWLDGTYTGELVDGWPHGQGKLTWENGQSYEGEWAAGIMHGHGTELYYPPAEVTNNLVVEVSYIGEWVYGQRHGKGIATYSDGSVAEVVWEYGTQIQKTYK